MIRHWRLTSTRKCRQIASISILLLALSIASILSGPVGCASSHQRSGHERLAMMAQMVEGVPISIQFTPDRVEFLPTDAPQKTVTATVQLDEVAHIGTKFTIEALAFVSDENDQGQALMNNQSVAPDAVSVIDEYTMSADSDSFTFDITVKHNTGTQEDVTVMIIVTTEDGTQFAMNMFDVVQVQTPNGP